jgi:hypothetical protein
VLHIENTKGYIYHGRFTAAYLQQIHSGAKVTESACIERYPEAGFDLDNMEQRDHFYKSIFAVIRYCTSNDAKIPPSNYSTKSKQINVHTPLWLVANRRTSKKSS